MRSLDVDLSSMPGNAVDFFHGARNRLDMLDDVDHADAVKAVVWKRVGKLVQVMNHVDPLQGRDVQPNASRPFVFPTTNIENLYVQRQFPCAPDRAASNCSGIGRQCKLLPRLTLGGRARNFHENAATWNLVR